MKKISKLLAGCCFVVSMSAQTQGKLNCEFNFKEALFYLKGDKNFKKDSLKSIEYLKPCLEKGDAKAQLLMGRLYNAKADEANYKKAFELFKKSAKQGNAIAMADLGVLYKYGRGCNLNFNKARKWFKKSAELGNDKASYSLGYLYLKGFGNIDQDYTKAVKWFEKSEFPMAKYWLGTCYYYGYGVEKNLVKANELLGTNFEITSTNNLEANTIEYSNNNVSSELEIDATEMTSTLEEVESANLLGKWKGVLLKYDWSGEHIEQKHNVKVVFENDSITQSLVYSMTIDEQENRGDLLLIDNTIYFEETFVKLPHTSFDERISNELIYELLSSNLSLKNIHNSNYLIGGVESYIFNFNESGAPLKMVLKKTETFANSDEELSDTVLQALADQEESFIKLYPNPFQTDLIVSYSLENPSFVEVRITDINGTKNAIIEKGKEQGVGKHSYFFDGNDLEKGLYLVTVLVDNEKKTRLIVKK